MKKIPFVDDHREFRELVKASLVLGGYEILAVENAIHVIRIARTELPNLILMDVMMPAAADGVEATIAVSSLQSAACLVCYSTNKTSLCFQPFSFRIFDDVRRIWSLNGRESVNRLPNETSLLEMSCTAKSEEMS